MSGVELRKDHVRKFARLSRYSLVAAYGMVAWYVVLIVLSIIAGHYVLQLDFGWLQASLVAALSIFVGTRLRGVNNIVHECTHNTFAEKREDNVRIGKLCCALLTGSFRTYKEDHLSHHSHLGDYSKDHEMEPIEKFGFHDPVTARTILRHITSALLGRHLPIYSSKNLSSEDGPVFAAIKFALVAGLVAFTVIFPFTSLFFVLIPIFYIFPTLNFWTDCIDHAGLIGETDELKASRNVLVSKPLRAIFFPRNDSYHLIHHLFPHVPARHFDSVHSELKKDQRYASEPLAVNPVSSALYQRFVSAFRSGTENGSVSTESKPVA